MGSAPKQKCPYCGALVRTVQGLTPRHEEDTGRRLGVERPPVQVCAGSLQNPRARGDMRPTWRDEERAGQKWDPYANGGGGVMGRRMVAAGEAT